MNWLERQARANPDAPAVRSGERVLTYAELAAAAARAAETLKAAGADPGTRIAVRLGNRLEHVVAVHGAAWAGAVLVEVHPKLAPAEVPELLKAAKADLLVAEASDPLTSPVVRPTLPCPVLGVETLEEALGGSADEGLRPPPAPQRADALHSILFTSGTTGRPRPVPLTCGNVLASAAASAWNLGVRPDDGWLCCLPLAHVGGLSILLRSVLQGTCVTLRDGFDPAATAELFRSGRVTLASLVPTMLRRLLEPPRAGGTADPGTDGAAPAGGPASPRFRAILLGGGPVDPELVASARDRGLPVLTTYGMTETASQVATLPPGAERARWGSAGLALPGAELAIHRRDGSPAPAGEAGEIAVRGPMVCQEAVGAGGWLATGDLGRLDEDGFLWVEGRLDELVVTGGENVSPREVERALREHPGVAEATVVGLSDPEWGRVVAAAVVPRDPAEPPEPEALAVWCRDRLAPFKVPRRWRVLDELPRTGSGKVAREQVRRLFV